MFPKGPIYEGAQLCVVSITSLGIPQVLYYNSQSSNYYWEPDIFIVYDLAQLPVFEITSLKNNQVTLTDLNNGGGMSIKSDGSTIGRATSPLSFNWSANDFNSSDDELLASEEYTFTFNNKVLNIHSNANSVELTPTTNLMFLPSLLWSNCSGNTFTTTTTMQGTLLGWYNDIKNGSVEEYWTQHQDCINNYNYNYCPSSQLCGTDNCNGPCDSKSDCEFDSDTSTYSCKKSSNRAWIILGVSLVIILIIIAIIVLVKLF